MSDVESAFIRRENWINILDECEHIAKDIKSRIIYHYLYRFKSRI